MAITMQPIKRTALYRTGLALGATMTDYAGWQIAARFRSPDEETQQVQAGVGLADAGWLGKLEIRRAGAAPQLSMGSCGSGVVGDRSLDPVEWQITGATVWPLAAGDLLVTCEPPDTPAVLRAIQDQVAAASEAIPPSSLYVTDVTSVYAALLLAGPHSRAVLQRLTALDVSAPALPDLACARTGLAHVHATLLRQDLGRVPAYWLLVGREYGAYVWDAVLHAGGSFGIVPIGLVALHHLRGAGR